MSPRLPPIRLRTVRLCMGWLVLLGSVCGLWRTHAAPVSDPIAVKAVFLYRFTGFVRWPESSFASSTAPFVIGILGPDPFGQLLDDAVRGENVDGHPIMIRQLVDAQGAAGCHVVYVAAGAERFLRDVRTRALTVGETDGFLAQGGIIRFVTEGNLIKLRINVRAARAAGLNLHSQLLRVAQTVEKD